MYRYDIAFRCSGEPIEPSRAKFLTQCDVNCKRGYQALQDGLIPCQAVIRDASWHHNIAPALNKFDASLSQKPQSLVDHLRQYDLASDLETSLSMQANASEQLALDLSLSMDILSPRPFSDSANDNLDAMETMSRATEAMSLTNEPPPIHLGYLRPKTRGAMNNLSQLTSSVSQELDGPLGVRLLLKEWDVGADPNGYTYIDPYDESDHVATAVRRLKSPPQTFAPAQTQSQRPPLVVASKLLASQVAPPPVAPKQVGIVKPQGSASGISTLRTGSQPIVRDLPSDASQQDYMASTQVLPGPHGGRHLTKKPMKKRLGGF